MPRERDPNREKAFELWRDSGEKLDLVEIATQLNISSGTVRGWKSKDKWDSKLNGTLQSKKRNAPKNRVKRSEQAERSNESVDNEQVCRILTEKQQVFVMEYLRDFNATRAAIDVGYSKRTAYSIGWELLRKPEIQAEIKRQKEMVADELGVSVQRIIAEYMKIAFADISDVMEFGQTDEPCFDGEGNPLINPETGETLTAKRNFVNVKSSNEVDGTVIGEVKQGRDGISIKMHDKLRALEKLGKYLNLMDEEQRQRVEKLKAEIDILKDKGW